MHKSKQFFNRLLIKIQKEIKLEKPKHYTLRAHLINTNKTMKDKYTKNELQEIKTHLNKNIKEITDLREEYLPVGVVILANHEEYPETCMFFS